MNNLISVTHPSDNYELLDSGDGLKLERFGNVITSRPDPQVLWEQRNSDLWQSAQAVFTRSSRDGEWRLPPKMPLRWQINFGGLKLWIKPTAFKHVGLFPEQQENWDWIRATILRAMNGDATPSVLNLFGYTGGASLAAAAAGASVCHVDSSKVAVTWARDNAALSGLAKKPIRWIVDDARIFVARELRRGARYDAIMLDPPTFGHGAKKELWKIEHDLSALLHSCKQLLSPHPLFFLVNGYAAGYSPLAYFNNVNAMMPLYGVTEFGELAIAHAHDDRLLPCGIFARWRAS